MSRKYDLFGFGDLFSQTTQFSYPPYNIRRIDETKFVLELAVAGFSLGELEVSMDGDKLVIQGNHKNDVDPSTFFYKGISNKSFVRSFLTDNKIEVTGVELLNGILKVFLSGLPTKSARKVFDINIPQPTNATTPTLLNEDSSF